MVKHRYPTRNFVLRIGSGLVIFHIFFFILKHNKNKGNSLTGSLLLPWLRVIFLLFLNISSFNVLGIIPGSYLTMMALQTFFFTSLLS